MVSTPWLLYWFFVLRLSLEAVAKSWTEEENCNGEGTILLQGRMDKVLHFREPNLNRWTVQVGLAIALAGSMVLLGCYFARWQGAGAGNALADKVRPRLEQSDCKLFNDYVTYWALKTPEKTVFRFCGADGEETETRSCSSLKARSSHVAHLLLDTTAFGDRVLLVYEPGLEFLDAFIGCLLSGRVAVPVYPPIPTQASSVKKFVTIQADCGAKVALTSSKYWWATAAFVSADWPAITWKVTSNLKLRLVDGRKVPQENMSLPNISSDNLAFLQYTSGSTGDPKGVMVSHKNLLANCLIPAEHYGNSSSFQRDQAEPYGPKTVVVLWLPQYHDMGLVCGYLSNVVWNCQLIGFSPMDFIQDPLLWPKLITRYRPSHTLGPHFGYQLAARRMEAGGLDLDLSSLTLALDGAEPINVRARPRMLKTWKRFGLRDGAYCAGYGLAEHVVKVAAGGLEDVSEESSSTRAAECGSWWKDVCLKIVDPATNTEVAEGEEGEIWLDSTSKACGYWGKPQLSEEIFCARLSHSERTFLRTGDLGFVRDGRLFVCGRIKNVIIVGGKNFYPQDIEQTVQEASEHVRPGHVVACSNAAVTEEEQLLLAVELRDSNVYPEALARELRSRVETEHGLAVWGLVLLRPRSLPKTTSGKLQHRQVAQLWESGFGSAVVEQHLWGQTPSESIDWSKASDRPARARLVEDWLLTELEGATPESKLSDFSLSSASLARLHSRLLSAMRTSSRDFSELYQKCPGPSHDLAQWSQDTYLRVSVESALPMSVLFETNLHALAVAAEEAKFPAQSSVLGGQQSGRREVIGKMPVNGTKQVSPWILWTWKTFGLLMPLLITVLPFFLLSAVLGPVHQRGGHGLVVALAPLLVAGLWLLLLFQVWMLRVALFPRGLKPGRYKVDSWMHLRLWQLDVTLTFLHRFGAVYRGTPVHNALLAALGARIGHGARLQLSARASCQLLRVDAGAVVEESSVKCHCLVDGELILAPIHLAESCSIAKRCVVEPGATLPPGKVLRALSTVPLAATVETDQKKEMLPGHVDWVKFFYVLVIHPYVFVGMLYIMFWGFKRAHGFWALMIGATVSLMLAGSAALMLFVLLKWSLVGRLCAGTMPFFRYSCFRVATWVLSSANIFISSVPEWLLRFFCYLCGAKVAGTAELTMPSWLRALEGGELVEIGSNTFLGGLSDFAFQGAAREFHEVRIGEECYTGAGSFLDFGCQMEANASLAASSYVLPGSRLASSHTFAGNPAVAISRGAHGSRRQKRSWLQWFIAVFLSTVQRAISLQPLLLLPVFSFWMKANCSVDLRYFWWSFCLISAAGYFLAVWCCVAIYWTGVIGLRLISPWPEMTLTEGTLGSHLWKMLMETLLLSRLWTSMLLQTPWFSAYLRLLGAKVGEKVSFDEDLGIHEPWLVEIGEGTQLGVARISPHSLEMDGSIVLRRVVLGRNVTLLEEAQVFGGTEVPDRCLLGSFCRPLKGQRLEAREYNWTPAR